MCNLYNYPSTCPLPCHRVTCRERKGQTVVATTRSGATPRAPRPSRVVKRCDFCSLRFSLRPCSYVASHVLPGVHSTVQFPRVAWTPYLNLQPELYSELWGACPAASWTLPQDVPAPSASVPQAGLALPSSPAQRSPPGRAPSPHGRCHLH